MTVNELGKALVRAREAAGLTQEAAADAVGLNRVVLSYYESGRRQPALGTLISLARLYGVSLAELLGEAEKKEKGMPPSEVLYRAAARELGSRARAGMQQFSDLVNSYVELIEDLGGSAPGKGVSPFRPARPRATRRDAARLAIRVRELLGLGSGPIDDLFRLVDEHVLVFRLALGSDLDSAPSGFFYNHPAAGFCIAVNSEMTLGRQVFTLAHELAHTFFHSHETDAVVSMTGAPLERERFADLFSGELLVPGDALARVIDELEAWEEITEPAVVVHLQRHFGVSYAALLVRLRQEGFIDQSQYEALGTISPSALARQLGYPVNPADLGDYKLSALDRFPDRFLRLVQAAVRKKAVTPGDAAETLGVDVEDIRLLLARPSASQTERKILKDLERATRSE
ncbi:MAG TPA: XRE family transcriptional regulator [Candidatus Acidoferrales bacterium]|nr:XRE family transcriptional regulator [Candidatus Acidoferrales bacterium]